jgi:fructose-bisphosphate aldolase class 1
VLASIALAVSVASWVGYRLLWNKQEVEALAATLERVEAVLDRMELKTYVVAADLTTAQTLVDKVATDLLESQQRADLISDGVPGEAADAGARSGS